MCPIQTQTLPDPAGNKAFPFHDIHSVNGFAGFTPDRQISGGGVFFG